MEYIDRYILYIVLGTFFWNLLTFLLMGLDKHKSLKNYHRVKESTLILISFLMGGLGTWVGSLFFKHKTKKMKFKVLLPIALLCNVGVFLLIFLTL